APPRAPRARRRVRVWRGSQGSLDCARAKSRENIIPLRRIEIAPGVADEAAGCGKAPAAQHLVRAEPGLGVFLVRVDREARVGIERARRPFPHIADHLAATGCS